MKAHAAFFALLVLLPIKALAQDTTCATLDTETVSCNDAPFGGCSSHASVAFVLYDSPGTFDCSHPAGQQTLN